MNEIWKGELLLPAVPPECKDTHCYQRQPWYPVAAATVPTNIVREQQESLETGSPSKCGDGTPPNDGTSSTLELTPGSGNSTGSSTGSSGSGGCCGKKKGDGKRARIVCYEEAPEHLQFNPFIRTGYRTYLSMRLCLESVFWWTNETVNIWSHIFGLFVFVALAYNDLAMLQIQAGPSDKLIVGMLLVSFQVCMILSSVYHTFSCHSATSYDRLLTFDLFGIALSLLAIFMSGIYYAFWCNLPLRNFYMLTIGIIFAGAMVLQIPRLQVPSHVKMVAFVAWAAYGIVPTLHWYYVMGGAESTMVQLFIPRVLVMYALSGVAFLIYVAKIPERWYVGRFDCIGHSHNLWHIIVLAALYYWHNSGMKYVEFRMIHGCAAGVQMA